MRRCRYIDRVGVSLKDIARRAEVSVATVSNVVNNYRPVAEETRLRVQRAVDELGYTPNLGARHLRHGRTGIIALAVPELTNPYFAELARPAIDEARAQGYTLLVQYTDGSRTAELDLLDGFRERRVDGLILSPVQVDRRDVLTRTASTPLVLIGEGVFDVPHDHIAIDNLAASHAAVAHLASLGRRRIAFVGAHPDAHRQPAHLRLDGYRAALAAVGLPYDPALVAATSQFGRQDGHDAMLRLLATVRPDAVFAYNDLIALGAIHAVLGRGLSVPGDVAVIGVDDIEDGRFANPTLTTIAPDKEHIGRVAVRHLIARIEDRPTAPPAELRPPFRLIARQSTLG